jgi:hypothetical protein
MMCFSAVTIPVIVEINTDGLHLLRQWARVYYYGHLFMPALCVGTASLFALSAYRKRVKERVAWSIFDVAALTTFAMVPFTYIAMTSKNDAMFALAKADAVGLDQARGLVVGWAYLHAFRSLFPLLGAICGFRGLLAGVRV